jgi:hypothetical protein
LKHIKDKIPKKIRENTKNKKVKIHKMKHMMMQLPFSFLFPELPVGLAPAFEEDEVCWGAEED